MNQHRIVMVVELGRFQFNSIQFTSGLFKKHQTKSPRTKNIWFTVIIYSTLEEHLKR